MVEERLLQYWRDTCLEYKSNDDIFIDLVKNYAHKSRYYHTLDHILAIFLLIEEHSTLLKQPVLVRFATFFHDAIYEVHKNNNEEKSALLAGEKLALIGLSKEELRVIERLIIATQKHILTSDFNTFDAKFFLDCDLGILGSSPELYKAYTVQIRNEYRIYPDFLYKPGRKKVLEHFLQQDRIYKTDLFYEKWEKLARQNIRSELEELK